MTDQDKDLKVQQEPFQIGINMQYLKDFSFESPLSPSIFAEQGIQPDVQLGVNVVANKLSDGHSHEVILKLKIETKIGEKIAFIVELAYAGIFALPTLSEEQTKGFLFIDAPHILYPTARSIVANAVRDGGFPQFLLNPIDFASLYHANKDKMAEEPAGNA